MKHGTPSGYRHYGCRCDRCRAASREAMRRHRGSFITTAVAISPRARERAVARLIEHHPEDFQRLLDDEAAREMTKRDHA